MANLNTSYVNVNLTEEDVPDDDGIFKYILC